jgi:Sel1 repeat
VRLTLILAATMVLAACVGTTAFAEDFAPALKLWRQQADQGDARAQKSLGNAYANGWGVKQSYAEAMTWYRKAANQNYAEAQFHLGDMYESGRGVKPDQVQAYMWYSLSVAAGDRTVSGRLDILAEKMTPDKIAEGKRRAGQWKPTATLGSHAIEGCTPSDADFAALAASPSRLTPSAYAALAPAQQKSVCDTRAFLREVDAQKGVIDDMGRYSTKYLSPAENDRVVDAVNHHLARIMTSKGL